MWQVTFSISEQHPALAGHFPGNPLVPAVVLLDELLSETAAIYPELMIHGFKQVKFLKPILPEEQIRVHLKSIRIGSIGFQAYRNEDMVFSGELSCEAANR